MVSNHCRALWSFSKLNSVPSRQYLKRSMVHLMARHSSCPAEHGVSHRTSFLLTPATGLFSSPSPRHHVLPLPLPEASVWVLKGTIKFSCICHRLYLFLMTFLDHLHTPFTVSPGSENTATIWRPVWPYPLAQFGLRGGDWVQAILLQPLPSEPALEALYPDYTVVTFWLLFLFSPRVAVFSKFLTPNMEM